ncbi:uncharacterized protein PFL1_06887 [Pseudozyma flocculosa PF-1]|uniref:CXXC-type zinc finger protein 1 n=2 Tax=Pseudozyma flocculosa TaxID=84751 RepID=A0A5C3EWF3_9BASI|nr:uncharacterized protein PFL1_06887 [Pseudozyma flocculosa PF-1]EPQ27393.1 hypothetical protein PFL1_06887 [Pseudozyma flocculosa PF-1]SPO36190.1 uncharacterized protein PSFLO_01661 [Pseudozyma flocculosa]
MPKDAAASTSANPIPPDGHHDEDDEDGVYCVCRRPYDENDSMILCDRCEQWYHYSCMDITEEQSLLIDRFICPVCVPLTSDRTTWSPKCRRDGCPQPAAAPLSRYCSERCGVLTISERMAKCKILKSSNALARLEADQNVKLARKPQGSVVWGPDGGQEQPQPNAAAARGPTEMDEETSQRAQRWHRTFEAVQTSKLLASLGPSDRWSTVASLPIKTAATTGGGTLALPSQAQLKTVQIQLAALEATKARLKTHLDLLDARQRLFQLVSESLSSLSPAPDGGGPKCGFDRILAWDDERLSHWLDAEHRRDAIFDAVAPTLPSSSTSNGITNGVHGVPDGKDDDDDDKGERRCSVPKRKCKRHWDWQNTKEVEIDVERSLLLQRLGRLEDSRADVESALVEAQQRIKVEAEAEREREDRRRRWLQARDEAVAREMAEEGKRRRAVGR